MSLGGMVCFLFFYFLFLGLTGLEIWNNSRWIRRPRYGSLQRGVSHLIRCTSSCLFFCPFLFCHPFFMCLRRTFFSMLSPSFSFVLLRRPTSLCSLCSGLRRAPKLGGTHHQALPLFSWENVRKFLFCTLLVSLGCWLWNVGPFSSCLKRRNGGCLVAGIR